jgi:hypothetical protein
VIDVFFSRDQQTCNVENAFHCTAPNSIPLPASPQTLTTAIDQLPQTNKWAVQYLFSKDDGRKVAMEIISGTAIAVSDGSYKDNFGTSAFIFECVNSKGRITGKNCIPGAPTDQSAHRSEVGGIVDMAITLKILCNMYDITSGKITLGLDGKTALNQGPQSLTHTARNGSLIYYGKQGNSLKTSPLKLTSAG